MEKTIGDLAVRLILPAKWRTHPTFHVSAVEPYTIRNGTNPNYNQLLREMSDIEADEEYDVHEIKNSIERRNRILYQVKWLGFSRKKDWTYEPYENFSEAAQEKIIEFHVRNPTAPKDPRLA